MVWAEAREIGQFGGPTFPSARYVIDLQVMAHVATPYDTAWITDLQSGSLARRHAPPQVRDLVDVGAVRRQRGEKAVACQ